ncbi:MAG: hypothetical protein GWN39_12335 [Thermoplasmata archaeon]|nr:hypothetical protein [Thermoplasmata archaeon]
MCACIALVGTMALAAWIHREEPVEVTIGELEDVEVGTLVTVEGTLYEVRHVDTASSILEVRDSKGRSVAVFCPFPFQGAMSGSRVVVTGRLTLYKGELEIVVEDLEDLMVTGGTRSPHVDVRDLAREPWAFEGMEPHVRVVLLTDPVADHNGEDRWCLVGEPSSDDVGMLVLLGLDVDGRAWKRGNELDLKVIVRYDASAGFVYLEVLDVL